MHSILSPCNFTKKKKKMRSKTAIATFLGAFYYLIFSSVTSLNTSNIDESSLLALKKQFVSNILAKNWSQESSFCTWIGVTCSRRLPHPRVTALDLSNMGLRGSIGREIGNLSFITSLNLFNNSLSGLIPPEIGELRRLRVLNMSSNDLSDHIPQSLGLLRKLERLQLSKNYLSGNIPQSLSACSELISVDFSSNNLTGNIPSGFGNLSRLQKLVLINNQLTGELPSTIFNISSLVTVVVGNNQMSGSIPREICSQSSKLQGLWLYQNQFEGEIPLSLMHCQFLKDLSLLSNNFIGKIPNHFWNLSAIEKISLAENDFTGSLPSSIGNLSNLIIFDITENIFHGEIPQSIGRLSNLTFLNLEENYLNGEVPQSIFSLSQLQILSLGGNFLLSGTLPFSIDKGIPKIQEIYLDYNKFYGKIPHSISNLSHLILLDLSTNSFTGNVPTTLGNLHQLHTLNLGNNHFTNNISIPDQDFISPLTSCKYLNFLQITNNPGITGALPTSLNFSASLENLLAGSCTLTGQIPHEIGNLSKLLWLDLAYNFLNGVVPITMGYLTNLQKLELQLNQLKGKTSHVMCNLRNLYSVNLSGNGFSDQLPNCFEKLSSLGEINFSNNMFEGSLPQEIGNLMSLTVLDLSANQLSGQIPSTVSQLLNLITLSLSNNKFSGNITDSFAAMSSLQHLDLSQNNLSGPIPESLEALSHLKYLNLSFNNLSGEIPDKEPFVNLSAGSFAGNEELCGAPRFKVKLCKISTPAPLVTKKKLLECIIPLGIGLVIVGFILTLLINRRGKKSPPPFFSSLSARTRISHREILVGTNNLDEENLIGKGSISSVYRGMFSNHGMMVAAVKIFDLGIQGALMSFDVECQVLSRVRHRNLVEVITCCSNDDFKALVMAYMPNGNLEKWLYSGDCSFSLLERVGVMVDVAMALEYLHQWHTIPIVHCDIKPSNILLDDEMVARVADFGIARLLTNESRLQLSRALGTIGYMAPEYGSEGLVSTMVDVYSYGILVMEMLLRRKPTDRMFSGEFDMKRCVAESFPHSIMEIVDDELLNVDDQRIERCLISCIGLALECVADLAEERPNMKDVSMRINKVKLSLSASD